jgi:hypothetical protein
MLKTGIRGGRSVHTFQVKSINDMLLKLGWEVGQLQRSHISKAADRLATSSYFAINGALTAFHICEWIWHCGSESQREIWGKGQRGGQPTKTNFQMHLRALCPSLSTCREIANSFKHHDARESIKEIVDCPNESIDTIIRSIKTNRGVLSGKLKAEFPILRNDDLGESITMLVGRYFPVAWKHL